MRSDLSSDLEIELNFFDTDICHRHCNDFKCPPSSPLPHSRPVTDFLPSQWRRGVHSQGSQASDPAARVATRTSLRGSATNPHVPRLASPGLPPFRPQN
jgi:hypothetical protein